MSYFSRPKDPRLYQIAVLGLLVAYGVVVLDFGIRPLNAAAILSAALLMQWVGTKLTALAPYDPRSPLITALSLTLLLRTDSIALAAVAAAIAIGSKFLIRARGKHVFNPANFAIVTMLTFTDGAWISTGQWGGGAVAALALACLGVLVLTHARRAETTITFLIVYASLLLLRALWLQDPLSVPLHALQNGALLIFAFFMISDPKTVPNTAAGRILFASFVALAAFAIQFVSYQPNGPILGLILMAPFVPLIDFVLRGTDYRWRDAAVETSRVRDKPFRIQPGSNKEESNESFHSNHHGDAHADAGKRGAGILRLLCRKGRHRAV